MNKNLIKNTLMMISGMGLALTALTGCNVTVSGGGYVDPYKRAWYDVYGTQCISYGYPMSGCNFYADGSKIRASEDPYYYEMTLYAGPWTYTDSYGYGRVYYGSAWLSDSGILYDQYGNALNEMDQDSVSADVIAMAAEKEEQMAKAVGKKFAAEYALNEEAGVQIAHTLQDWATIGRDRSRTAQDIADFSKRLYGVSLDKATGAIDSAIKGDKEPLVDLNIDVAAHWGTSPETSKAILLKWYKDELSQVGIR